MSRQEWLCHPTHNRNCQSDTRTARRDQLNSSTTGHRIGFIAVCTGSTDRLNATWLLRSRARRTADERAGRWNMNGLTGLLRGPRFGWNDKEARYFIEIWRVTNCCADRYVWRLRNFPTARPYSWNKIAGNRASLGVVQVPIPPGCTYHGSCKIQQLVTTSFFTMHGLANAHGALRDDVQSRLPPHTNWTLSPSVLQGRSKSYHTFYKRKVCRNIQAARVEKKLLACRKFIKTEKNEASESIFAVVTNSGRIDFKCETSLNTWRNDNTVR